MITDSPCFLSNIHEKDLFLATLLFSVNDSDREWQAFISIFSQHFGLSICRVSLQLNTSALSRPTFEYIHPDFSSLPDDQKSDLTHDFEVVSKNKHTQLMLTAKFPTDLQDNDYITRINALKPVIQQALSLRLKISSGDVNAFISKQLLNQLRSPTAILSESNDVLFMNKEMANILEYENAFQSYTNDSLTSLHNNSELTFLNKIIRTIRELKSNALHDNLDSFNIYGKNTYLVGIQAMETDTSFSDLSILFIATSAHASPVSSAAIRNTFNLTQAESEVCHLFISGMPLNEISKIKQKSLHTVREQLKTCYQKTHTKNQLELMKLISSLPIK